VRGVRTGFSNFPSARWCLGAGAAVYRLLSFTTATVGQYGQSQSMLSQIMAMSLALEIAAMIKANRDQLLPSSLITF
jgi:hypothetical protein